MYSGYPFLVCLDILASVLLTYPDLQGCSKGSDWIPKVQSLGYVRCVCRHG